MENISEGQCGLCLHFGEHHPDQSALISIRRTHQASEVLTDECAHPQHAPLHLVVTALSGCEGFELAPSPES